MRELVKSLAARGFRVDVVSLPFHAHPPLGGRAPGARLAAARAAPHHGRLGRPRDPDQVPELPGAAPPQGGLGVPPVPRGLRAAGHRAQPARRQPRGPRLVETIRTHGQGGARRVPGALQRTRRTWRIGSRASTALHATPLYPPPQQLGRYRCDSYSGFLLSAGRLDRTKRPELLLRALARASKDVAAQADGRGPAAARPRAARRRARRRGPRGLPGLRRGGRARGALRDLPRRRSTRPSTRTSAT